MINLRPLPVFEAEGAAAGAAAGREGAAAGAAAAGAAAGAGANALAGNEGAAAGAGTPAKIELPETWRDFFADDDEGKAELQRFKSPKDLTKTLLDRKKQLSKGAKTLEDAPDAEKEPEKLKTWREERGIPTDATGYTVPDDIKKQITDIDKPIVDGYLQFMHKRNATPKEVSTGLEYYYGLQAAQQADMVEADNKQAKTVDEELKGEWGADFRANKKIAERAAREAVPGVDWFKARLPDGRALGNIPDVVRFLTDVGLWKFGAEGAYEDGGDTDAVSNELETLKKEMNTDIKAWRANKTGQKRYQELLDAKQRRAR